VKGVASKGVRLGDWLTVKQAQTLLNTPDASTTKGLRDRAILTVLQGCGLRRSECAALTFGHVQQRDGRWCIKDLVGKARPRADDSDAGVGQGAIDAWTTVAGISCWGDRDMTRHRRLLRHSDAQFRWFDDPGYVPTQDPSGNYIPDPDGRRPGIYTVLNGPPNFIAARQST
jgi:hypothetical protein